MVVGLHEVVKRGLAVTVFTVFDSNPDETANLRNDPDGEGEPCTLSLRPALHVQKLAIPYDHRNSNCRWDVSERKHTKL